MKIEPKLEVKQEIKAESKVKAQAKEKAQNTSFSSVPADVPDSSKKRKSPEAEDQDKQAGGLLQEVDQVPVPLVKYFHGRGLRYRLLLKKVKTTNDTSRAQPQAEPASADSEATQPVYSYGESMGKIAGPNAGELAPNQNSNQTIAENENHVSLEACREDEENFTSEWEGFESDEDIEDSGQLSEADNTA